MDRLLATAISEPVGDCAWTKSHTATDTKRYGTRPDLAILKIVTAGMDRSSDSCRETTPISLNESFHSENKFLTILCRWRSQRRKASTFRNVHKSKAGDEAEQRLKCSVTSIVQTRSENLMQCGMSTR
jgi:hypothetical protein